MSVKSTPPVRTTNLGKPVEPARWLPHERIRLVLYTTNVAAPFALMVAMSMRLPTPAKVNAADADEKAVAPAVVTPSLTIRASPFAPKYFALTGNLAGSAAVA